MSEKGLAHLLCCEMQAALYDLWVLRDTEGNMMGQRGAQSNYTAQRMKAGLPFPVTTCWNGMVILPAKPFQQGLRFRQANLLWLALGD